MARGFALASTEALYTTSVVVSGAPFTIACWAYVNDITNTHGLMGVSDEGTSNNSWALYAAGGWPNDPAQFSVQAGGAPATASTSPNSYSASAWQHFCGIEASSTSRFVLLNGGFKVQNTTSATPSGIDNLSIGAIKKNTYTQPADGKIALPAVWSAALDDYEVAALAAGEHPYNVRPQNLVFFADLVRDEDRDLVGGLALSVNGTPTIETHAPFIWMPPPRQLWIAPPAATTPTLTVANLSQSNTVSKPAVTKESTLSTKNLSQSNTVDKLTLTIPSAFPFIDSFESGNTNAWDGDYGSPVINVASALHGTYGLEGDYTVEAAPYITWSSGPTTFYISFQYDLNDVAAISSGRYEGLVLFQASGRNTGQIRFQHDGSNWGIYSGIQDDTDTWQYGAWQANIPSSGTIEIEISFVNTNGYIKIWLNGNYSELTGVDIGSYPVTYVEFGTTHLTSNATGSGTYYVDDFKIYEGTRPVAAALSQSNTVDKITLTTGAPTLSVKNLSQDNTVDKVGVTTTYALSVKNLSQDNLVEKLTITQLHILSVNNLSQSHTIEKIDLTAEGALAVRDLSQNNKVTHITLAQLHNLQVDNLSQSHIVQKLTLTVQGELAIFPLSQTNTVDKLTVVPGTLDLVLKNLHQSNTVNKLGVFSQYATLVIDDLSQNNKVTHLSLTQVHNIQSAFNLSQTSTVEKVAIWTSNQMSLADLIHSNSVTTFTLVQEHNLGTQDLAQDNSLDLVFLWDWWYEIVEEVGLVTQTLSVVGYVEQLHEEYGVIDMELDETTYIDQLLEEDAEIAQSWPEDGMIAITVEQDGEI